MRKSICLISVGALLFLQGCAVLRGGKTGLFGGVPAVENSRMNRMNPKKNLGTPDEELAFGYLSGLHVALTVGLFMVNPIIGGAYLGANVAYGMGRLNESK